MGSEGSWHKQISVTILLILLLPVVCVQAGDYSGGDGSAENPYRIATTNDMNEIGANPGDWDDNFVMVNDVNLADYTGTQFNIIGNYNNPFTGIFDGNDHIISNFTYTCTYTHHYIGLFGYVGSAGQIKNVAMENVSIEAAEYSDRTGGVVAWNEGTISNCYAIGNVSGVSGIAGLVGANYYGTISNCYATGSILGVCETGGLVGYNCGTVSNCYATGSVSGDDDTGGLVGKNLGGTVSDCYATGAVDGIAWTGGLVGGNCTGTISNCYATGSILGVYETGGLVGSSSWGTISNCYATGDVDGNDYTGGLVGEIWYGTVSNCYAATFVTGDANTGGLVGENWWGAISDCYAVGDVNGINNTGGLIGFDDVGSYTSCFWDSDVNPDVNGIGNTTEPNVIGELTTNMMKESTFTDAGWDFIEIWNIGENQTYPYLRVYPAGDLNHDGRVNFHDFAILTSYWLEGIE